MDDFLLLPKQGKTRTRLNAWLEPVEDDIRISMELDSTEMMKRFVMAGLGLSFLAVSNCREEIAAGKLRGLPLAPEPMVRRLGLIYRKDKALPKPPWVLSRLCWIMWGTRLRATESEAQGAAGDGLMNCKKCRKRFEDGRGPLPPLRRAEPGGVRDVSDLHAS